MAMPCVRCGAYTASLAMISYVDVNGNVGVVRPLCDKCGDSGPARDARSIPTQADTELPPSHEVRIGDIRFEDIPFRHRTGTNEQIAQAIVNHATTPLVSPERRKELEVFVRTIRIVEDAFGFKLGGDSDCSKDILILDTRRKIPQGYYYDARIMPSGELEVAEWILDDETEATKQ